MIERPADLGAAFFYFDGKLVDIAPHRNHRDWLLEHVMELPRYVLDTPSKALFEAYKLGWIRIVWDIGGVWQHGKAANQGNTIYLNGIDKYVWQSIKGIMNSDVWIGVIDNVVIEYLDIIDDNPKWNRTDIYHLDNLGYENFDNLYKGRKPNRSLAPSNAVMPFYAEETFYANKRRNIQNDT